MKLMLSRRQLYSIVAFTLILLMVPVVSAAQGATFSGRVTNADLDALSGAAIQLPDLNRGTLTDPRGVFTITGLPAGEHRVIVQVIGFRSESVSVSLSEGERTTRNFALAENALALEGMVVQGQSGQAEAFNRQRTAANIRNVVSSEQIERFPDSNISDVLRRVPGVAAQTDRGETGFVFLRGLNPSLTSVTIDGERVPSTDRTGRGTSLSGVPAEMLESLEVVKAITPDMDADAVAGSIDLRSRRPTARQVDGRIEGGVHSLADGGTGRGAVSFGNRWGPLGVVVGGDYSRQERATQNIQYQWTDPDIGNATSSHLDRLRLQHYPIDRTRESVNALVDFRPSDATALFIRGMISRYDTREERHRLTYRLDAGDRVSDTEVTGGRTERQAREYLRRRHIYQMTGGGERVFDWGRLEASVSWSEAYRLEPYRDYLEFRQSDVDMRGEANDRLFPTVTVLNGSDPHDLSDFGMRYYEQRRDRMDDRDASASANLEIPTSFGSVKLGGRYRARSKDRDFDRIRFSGIAGDAFMSEFGGGADARTVTRHGYRLGPIVDWDQGRSWVDTNAGRMADDPNRTREESDSEDFVATEDVAAGYAMATIERGPWMLLGGMRYEHTRTSYDGKRLLFDGDGGHLETTPIASSGAYGDVFPMVHLRYRLDEASNVRLAYTSTIGRPDFISLAPNEFISFEDEFVRRGNPELRPLRAHNLDLLVERYFASIGVVSGGLFIKRLSGFPFTFREPISGGELDGFELIEPRNGEAATVYGLELAWHQRFEFLPGALAGLGLFANYTYSGSDVDFGPGMDRDLPLPEQVPHVANAALTYDRAGFSGLVSMNYQSAYYQTVGSTVMDDRILHRRRQIDLSASQRLTRNLRAFVQMNNLTNEPFLRYYGSMDFPDENEFEGVWGSLGLRFNY